MNQHKEAITLITKLRNKPWVTYTLCGICIIIYLLECLSSHSFNINNATLFKFGALFTPAYFNTAINVIMLPRLFTAMFIHLTPMHIFSNMIFLLIIGRYLEPVFGHVRFLILYLTSGIVGDICALRFSQPYSLTAGASTALFGLLIAGVLLPYLLRAPQLRYFGKQMLVLLVANIVVDLLTPSISLLGHLGGAVGGIIFGYLLRPMLTNVAITKLPWEILFSGLTLAAILAIFVFA